MYILVKSYVNFMVSFHKSCVCGKFLILLTRNHLAVLLLFLSSNNEPCSLFFQNEFFSGGVIQCKRSFNIQTMDNHINNLRSLNTIFVTIFSEDAVFANVHVLE